MTSASEQFPPQDWSKRQLHDLCYVVGGGTPSRSQPKYWNGDIPWASVKDFSDEAVFLHDTKEYITQEGLESSASTLIQANTPVVCTRMAVGRCALTTKPTAINQDLKALPLRDGFDSRFFIRLLKFRGSILDRVSVGSTVRGITTNDLLSLTLCYPDKSEQARIAAVLDTVDEAIAKTGAIIAKLKQVRAGLLHDLLTRGLDENGQFRDPIASPEQFQHSALGRIPLAWNVVRFDQLANVIDPQPDHRAPTEVAGGEPYIGVGDFLLDGSINFETCRRISHEALAKQQARFCIECGDILFGKIGTIGLPRLLPSQGTYALNANTVLIKPIERSSYVYWLLHSYFVNSQIQADVHSTSQPAFGIQKVRAMPVPLPTSNERRLLGDILDASNASIRAEEVSLEKLEHLKSGLMADLLTGRVRRVPEGIAVVS